MRGPFLEVTSVRQRCRSVTDCVLSGADHQRRHVPLELWSERQQSCAPRNTAILLLVAFDAAMEVGDGTKYFCLGGGA